MSSETLQSPFPTISTPAGTTTNAALSAAQILVSQAPDRQRQSASVLNRKIMIVDDEEYNILVLRKHLKNAGYTNIVYTDDSTRAITMIRAEQPDILLLDIVMPEVTGLDILSAIMELPAFENLPVLILSASTECEIKQAALELRATDFLAKPIDQQDLLPRVRNALLTKSFRDQLARHAEHLEAEVAARTTELEESRREVVYCLARAGEFRDDCTGHHVTRVGRYVGVIARQFGYQGAPIDLLELAAQLHDVGKIGIPDRILKKPGKLETDEFAVMQQHCEMGLKIITPTALGADDKVQRQVAIGPDFLRECKSPLMALAARIAATHHERWDGTGYPCGLKGNEIPIEGRMTAVADVFDSLRSARPYKEAFPVPKCFAILEDGRGKHFDPQVLDAFFQCQDEILRLSVELADPSSAS
jgi:putative two-component system response regulator